MAARIELTPDQSILFFTGAGMSAESGVPVYRGRGGIWSQYRYEEYACQRAFDRDPVKVLDFHELRRERVLACEPHAGYHRLAQIQERLPRTTVVTQNIDGLHQRAGIRVAAELHGSLWRVRCRCAGVRTDAAAARYARRHCEACGSLLRPDITWFEDSVDTDVFERAAALVDACTVFVAVGTSGVVWPAAGLATRARAAGARMIEVNPEDNEASPLYDERLRLPASRALSECFILRGAPPDAGSPNGP